MAEDQSKQDSGKVIARSGHFKDYYFQPGVITGVGDGTNQGLVRFSVQIGQQSSGDDDDNGKWAYPFIMPNHAAYSTPVVGSKIWVMTNETNPDEIYYWLMPELNPNAQSMIDGGTNGDVWGCRQDGLGTISVASSSESGYTFSTPHGEINAGGGSNYSIDSQNVGSKSGGGKYNVGQQGNGSEAMVLGNQLKDILRGFIIIVTKFTETLKSCDPPSEPAVLQYETDIADTLTAVGMEDWLSDCASVSDNVEAAKQNKETEKKCSEIDNLSNQKLAEKLAAENNPNFAGMKPAEIKSLLDKNKGLAQAFKESYKEGIRHEGKSGGTDYSESLRTLTSLAKSNILDNDQSGKELLQITHSNRQTNSEMVQTGMTAATGTTTASYSGGAAERHNGAFVDRDVLNRSRQKIAEEMMNDPSWNSTSRKRFVEEYDKRVWADYESAMAPPPQPIVRYNQTYNQQNVPPGNSRNEQLIQG